MARLRAQQEKVRARAAMGWGRRAALSHTGGRRRLTMDVQASDKQAERDALRAKRAQEARERQFREQELAAARKREQINRDLAQARERQQAERERRLADMARQEKEEFQSIIEVQKSVRNRTEQNE